MEAEKARWDRWECQRHGNWRLEIFNGKKTILGTNKKGRRDRHENQMIYWIEIEFFCYLLKYICKELYFINRYRYILLWFKYWGRKDDWPNFKNAEFQGLGCEVNQKTSSHNCFFGGKFHYEDIFLIYSSPHLMFHLNVKSCYQPEAFPLAICHFDKMQSYRSFQAPAESRNCFESVTARGFITIRLYFTFSWLRV